MSYKNIIVALLGLLLVSCSGGDSSNGTTPVTQVTLSFERIDSAGLDPIQVTATVTEDGQPVVGVAGELMITAVKGVLSAVTEIAAGVYQFTITPSQTGEHPVTVTYDAVSVTRTPLVVAQVDANWGQPMSVSGLVNTAGYEDGVTISPDGEYLFVQYGALYFTGLIMFPVDRASGGCSGDRLSPTRCTHAWLDDVIGPIAAPERPAFFADRMVNGMHLHNAISWGIGVEGSPILAPTTMFYGFRRQDDGTFAEPFYLAFNDLGDGLINPFGMSFHPNGNGTATMLFSMNDADPSAVVDVNGDGMDIRDSGADIYSISITLGQNTNLGSYDVSGLGVGTPPIRSTPFDSQRINFGDTGTEGNLGLQGNPHLHVVNGQVRSIWTDDERDNDSDTGEITVFILDSGTLNSGNWTKILLPSNVNVAGSSHEIQPYFNQDGLYFTRSGVSLPEVYFAAYSGGHNQTDLTNNANWSMPVKILGLNAGTNIGEVTAIGEPTVGVRNGEETLYFVYGIIRDNQPGVDGLGLFTDVNMQAGFVKRR